MVALLLARYKPHAHKAAYVVDGPNPTSTVPARRSVAMASFLGYRNAMIIILSLMTDARTVYSTLC